MAEARRKLLLTGCRTGMTTILGGYQFVNGHTIVRADNSQIDGVCRYLGRTYKAFEEGTAELAHYQRLDKEATTTNGKCNAEASPKPRDSVAIPSSVQPQGTGTAAVSSDDGSRATGATSGSEGTVPNRDGHQDSGNDRSSRSKSEISKAIAALDPSNDEHWTSNGRPRVDAVANAVGIPNLTRRDIDAVAEDVRRPE